MNETGLQPGPIRSPAIVVLLVILTAGIYSFYWWWTTLNHVKAWRNGEGWSGPMILIVFIPLVGLIVVALFFLLPAWIADLYRRHGQHTSLSAAYGLIIFIPFIGGIIWFVVVQNALNRFWESQGAAA